MEITNGYMNAKTLAEFNSDVSRLIPKVSVWGTRYLTNTTGQWVQEAQLWKKLLEITKGAPHLIETQNKKLRDNIQIVDQKMKRLDHLEKVACLFTRMVKWVVYIFQRIFRGNCCMYSKSPDEISYEKFCSLRVESVREYNLVVAIPPRARHKKTIEFPDGKVFDYYSDYSPKLCKILRTNPASVSP